MNRLFRFIKKIFFIALLSFTCNASNGISMNNKECKIRPKIVNIDSNKLSFYLYTILVNKCSGSYSNINDPHAKLCIFDVVKNMNITVFNIVSRTNETLHIKWHKNCKCKCRLDTRACNNKQRSNNHKCRCECKKLIEKGIFYKRFIWGTSNCELIMISNAMLENI